MENGRRQTTVWGTSQKPGFGVKTPKVARGGEAEQINQHGPPQEMEKGGGCLREWHPKIRTGGSNPPPNHHRREIWAGKAAQTWGGDAEGEEMPACHIRGKAVVAALPLAAPTLATCTHRYFVGVDSLIHPPPPPSFHHVSLIVTVTTVNWFCNLAFRPFWSENNQPCLSLQSSSQKDQGCCPSIFSSFRRENNDEHALQHLLLIQCVARILYFFYSH